MPVNDDLEEFHRRIDLIHRNLREELGHLLSAHVGSKFEEAVHQRDFAVLLNRALDRIDAGLAVDDTSQVYRVHVRETPSGRYGFQLQRPDGRTNRGFSTALFDGVRVIERPLNKRQLKAFIR